MAREDLKMNLPKITVDDLFSTQETRDSEKLGKVINIKLKDIDDFANFIFDYSRLNSAYVGKKTDVDVLGVFDKN